MVQNSVEESIEPQTEGELSDWREGDTWFGGGTHLFARPNPGLRRLVDRTPLDLPNLVVFAEGLEITTTCTVWLDRLLIHSCATVAQKELGHEITTIEGLANDGTLHSMQENFSAPSGVSIWLLHGGDDQDRSRLDPRTPSRTAQGHASSHPHLFYHH